MYSKPQELVKGENLKLKAETTKFQRIKNDKWCACIHIFMIMKYIYIKRSNLKNKGVNHALP